MLHRHEYKDLIWIDLESPSIMDVKSIVEEFKIDQIVADELLSPTLRPHTDKYDGFLYLVLHFPTLSHPENSLGHLEHEVDFIIGKDFIITTRYQELESFEDFRKVFEVNASLDDDHLTDNPFDIFLLLTRRLYKTVENEINIVRETLEHIESEVFKGREKEMVVSLSKTGRDILNLKQALDPHQEVLSSLRELTVEFAGSEYATRVKAIENMYYRSRKHITRIWQTLTELRETNNSLLSTKQNEVMKVFTILAFVTFPLSLVASIFGMNTENIPFVGQEHDFWIVIGMMLFATFFMFLFFKRKGWL